MTIFSIVLEHVQLCENIVRDDNDYVNAFLLIILIGMGITHERNGLFLFARNRCNSTFPSKVINLKHLREYE